MSDLQIVLIVFLGIPAGFLAYQAFGRYTTTYKCTEDSIDVLSTPMVRIPYRNILEIRQAGWADSMGSFFWFGARTQNRIFGTHILIKAVEDTKSRSVYVTPDNPDQFIADIKQRVARAKGA